MSELLNELQLLTGPKSNQQDLFDSLIDTNSFTNSDGMITLIMN